MAFRPSKVNEDIAEINIISLFFVMLLIMVILLIDV